MRTVTALITDLDNTLWDWVEIWGETFNALIDGVAKISGVPRDRLLEEARSIHQTYGTSEYTMLLQALPSIIDATPVDDIPTVYSDAICASQAARKKATKLFPGVAETLGTLQQQGCNVIGYTESMFWASSQRIRQTGLDGVLSVFYSPPDHDYPSGVDPRVLRRHGEDRYELKETRHRSTPKGQTKPSPDVLRGILRDQGISASATAYVGDSKMKDIAMAQEVGVEDFWAHYGQADHTETYALLRLVTHWTEEDVESEKRINSGPDINPTHTLTDFAQLLDYVRGPRG